MTGTRVYRLARRASSALAALGRWLGWWAASGLLVSAGAHTAWRLARSMEWDRPAIEWNLGTGTMGILLVALLWRRRRSKDGAVAAAVLTAGFWVAIWVLVWPLL